MSRFGWLTLGLLLCVGSAGAQERPSLEVSDGRTQRLVALATARGWMALEVGELTQLGWSIQAEASGATLEGPDSSVVELRDGSPFLRWDGRPLQMVNAPYFEAGRLMVPLQLVADFLPWRLPDVYAFDGPTHSLRVTGIGRPQEQRPPPVVDTVGTAHPAPGHGVRVVIIDAGHGGADPGSISKSGIREKTVALGIAMAMAKALEGHPGLEVRLLRDDDTFVPLWERGAIATKLKGDAPGVFVSVHANSFTNSARGFETYFLSDARTEHERRVAAIENAPIALEDGSEPPGGELDFILRDMKNLDTQHWSSLLAEMVQMEVAKIHPGPNRGVKQAPLAVITNSLMPSVLFEVGYLSHPEEARLLARSDFQVRTGEAIADAVLRFFERYPPGAGSGAGEGP